ncbi:uncharacterized protein J8A68_004714 [[Candida] subhashii]|uniref:Uncharacterized protein n=1 Tax=[Candida] subhashii TaxID=561895 RepID=A0A8J5QIH6_9ASCO|nr:uncharacterized protein J8A68_004714 [[Candida] subhashii]KAG7661766.1 hypothetical protein J8A68_004714 [[Candida] subhashii]
MIRTVLHNSRALTSGRRFLSTLLSKNPDKITLEDLKASNQDDIAGRMSLIKSINLSANSNKQQLINELIPDFSIYFKLDPAIKNTNEVLSRIIQVNPGRVHSSWELFQLHSSNLDEISVSLIKNLLNKLITGEAVDQSENYIIDFDNLHRLQTLLTDHIVSDISQYESDLIQLLDKLIQDDSVAFIGFLINDILSPPFIVEYMKTFHDRNTPSENCVFLLMVEKVLEEDPTLLTTEQYIKALDIINLKSEQLEPIMSKQVELSKHLSIEFKPSIVRDLDKKILKYIQESDIDLEAGNILLRQKIIESYGIFSNDTESALKKFHQYQTHASYGIEFVGATLAKVFGYQAINQNKEIYAEVAATLAPPDSMTVRLLQSLIISQSFFKPDSGLSIYNNYINQVGSDLIQNTGRSSKGLLTEAVVLGFLQNNDRSFASLIFEKAIDNKIITYEPEISTIKKLFKAYSDCFVEDEDWSKAKIKMKEFVLKFMKNL